MKKKLEDEFIQVQDLCKIAIAKWPWFIISLVISLSLAFIYISITTPTYIRSASILIKDNSKSGISSDEMNTFSDMGLFHSNTNINNEILTFKSPLLIRDVVQRLKLNENYSIKGFFRDEILYKDAPITILLDSLQFDYPFSCSIKLLPQNKVEISNFILNGNQSKESDIIEGFLSEPIQTPWGKFAIFPTSYYSEKYIGEQILFSKSALSDIVNHYLGALNASLDDEKSTIIGITVTDVSVRRAEDILNALITAYNENWIKDKNQVAVNTSRFIGERLNLIESELGSVDDNISQFKSQNLMPDIQASSLLYMNQSSENYTKILALSTQYTIANYILSYLKDPLTKGQLLPANLGVESTNIEGQIGEYNSTLLKYNTMLANSSDKNPKVSDMNLALDAMRKAIIHSIDNSLITLDTQIRDTQKSERHTTERIASSPKQAKYLLSVERQQKVKEALYLFLLQKREENELSQAFTAYNTKVITPPSGKLYPATPHKKQIFLAALVIGILIPIVTLYLIEYLNTTLRGQNDLQFITLPFLGEIPAIRREYPLRQKKLQEINIVVQEQNSDYINEAFRILRTNIDFIFVKKNVMDNSKVIMNTSFNPGSGKTFISINLAICMALKNKKVILIDLDMRRASLSAYVNSPKKGISSYLSQAVNDVNEIIVKGKIHPNVDIIPVGIIPPNPTELLLNDNLKNLLCELRRQYDYIILDCTPTGIVADATIVGENADLTIFIMKIGLMERKLLAEVEDLYQNKIFKNMTVVLNGSKHMQDRYGYNYNKA